jgi:hypothetical protein
VLGYFWYRHIGDKKLVLFLHLPPLFVKYQVTFKSFA